MYTARPKRVANSDRKFLKVAEAELGSTLQQVRPPRFQGSKAGAKQGPGATVRCGRTRCDRTLRSGHARMCRNGCVETLRCSGSVVC